MSLINKMLQDLDARGSAPGAAAPPNLKPVGRGTRTPPLASIGAAAALALVLAAGIGFWWMKRTPPPVHIGPVPAMPIKAVQRAAPAVVVEQPVPVQAGPVPEPEPEAEAPVAKPVRAARVVVAAAKPAAASAARPVQAAPQAPLEAGRQMTPRQRAESEYIRALAALQEGRVTDALAALEQALAIEPRHDAARQTLVGLLVEGGRKGPAMRVLQNGLALDPRQPSMAMLLARLQIEGGTSGIETLMRTLPYAQGNGEYHAFLAGALARDERHREAAEQYQAALRNAPGNGIWWMGLGVSLQAEKRTADAVAAFERARSSTNLTPQLRAFVDRKLELLSR